MKIKKQRFTMVIGGTPTTVYEIAKKTGLKTGYVSKVFNRKRRPRLNLLKRIAAAIGPTGVSLDALVYYLDNTDETPEANGLGINYNDEIIEFDDGRVHIIPK